jgi:hypothetical protein
MPNVGRSRFMFPEDVAEEFLIPVSTLRYWNWSGRAPEGFPPAVKLGRRIAYERVAVEAFVQQRVAEAEERQRVGAEAGSS